MDKELFNPQPETLITVLKELIEEQKRIADSLERLEKIMSKNQNVFL